MRLGQRGQAVDTETVSTGSLGLDLALGIGGFPKGRIVEIYGPEFGQNHSGAACGGGDAEEGRHCAFIDAEHALDPAYARKLGVDLDGLLISSPIRVSSR